MRHPSLEDWSDFVRGTTGPDETTEMDRHLSEGCGRCSKQRDAMRAVARVARFDRKLEIPTRVLASVMSGFRIQRLLADKERATKGASLVFDSLLAPAATGTRAGQREERHLVYESGDLTLEIHLHPVPSSTRWRIDGQLFDASAEPFGDIAAFLIANGSMRSQVATGPEGTFSLTTGSGGAAELDLILATESPVEARLPRLG